MKSHHIKTDRLRTRARLHSSRLQLEWLEDRCLLDGGLSDPNQVVMPTHLPPQPAGVSFVDSAFGTTLRRVSDTSERGGFETQIYSQLQAFSSDSEYLLLTGSDGYVVRRVDDLSRVAGLETSNWNVPRWHPTRPHVLVHFDRNDDSDVTLQFTDVDSLVTDDVFTFPAMYETILGNQSFDEVSDDGRWIAGMVTRNDGERVIFTLNIETRTLGALVPVTGLYDSAACSRDPEWGVIEPDWIAPSPLGRYLVVQWPRDGVARCSGLETFDIEAGAFVGRVYDGHQHGDLGVMPDGVTEFFMTFELAAPPPNNDRPAIGVRLLPGTATVSEPTFVRVLDWGNGEHISCRGPNGVCVVTAGTLADNGWNPFEGEVFIQRTDGSVLRLAHHRSSSCGYWVQPRATISRDGRYVVFASDWAGQSSANSCRGGNDLGSGDPYIIDLGATPPEDPPADPPPDEPPSPSSVSADLSVTALAAPEPARVGRKLVYTLTVSNSGGLDATDARLTYTLPRGVRFISAVPSQGSCRSRRVVVCNLARIDSGDSATVLITVRPTAARRINNQIEVTTTSDEHSVDDNIIMLEIEVVGRRNRHARAATHTATGTASVLVANVTPDFETRLDKTVPPQALGSFNRTVRRGIDSFGSRDLLRFLHTESR